MSNALVYNSDGSVSILCGSKSVLIDATDLPLVNGYQWSIGTHGYATSGSGSNQVLLHRLLVGAEGYDVDHINRDKLDNRRENLRVCNQTENRYNAPAQRNSQTQYRGVTLRSDGRWQAQITNKKKAIYLGAYATAEEAANAYDSAAAIIAGEFAWRNCPDIPLRSNIFQELKSIRRKGYLQEHEIDNIWRLREQGLTQREIAERIGRSICTVGRILNGFVKKKRTYRGRTHAPGYTYKRHPRWLSVEQTSQLEALIESGYQSAEIANIIDCSLSTVNRHRQARSQNKK